MALPPAKPTNPLPPLELPAGLQIEYINLVRIAHSASELVFDFAQILPGHPQAQVLSRVVMAPLGAKLFLRALAENLSRYETAFGEINIPGDSTLADHLFRPHSPGAPGGNPPASPPDTQPGDKA